MKRALFQRRVDGWCPDSPRSATLLPPYPASDMQQTIANLLHLLATKPYSEHVFNPWYEVDPDHDIGPEAPAIRRQQLQAYLNERRKTARYVLIGEALGYQGGHFSGMAMTSERILLDKLTDKGIEAKHVLNTIAPRRTSKPAVKKLGFTEPTATIAWGIMMELGLDPRHFVIWNTFAWHPYNPKKGMLSNRRPTDEEVSFGFAALVTFLQIFQQCEVIAVGKVAMGQLSTMVDEVHEVRHPANGGATKFRDGIRAICGECD